MTCGTGIRTRKVNCEIFLQVSRTTAVLPDMECPGIKPVSRETCRKTECGIPANPLMNGEISNKIDRLTPGVRTESQDLDEDEEEEEEDDARFEPGYTWRSGEMTACSASCLGGKTCLLSLWTFMVLTEAPFGLFLPSQEPRSR